MERTAPEQVDVLIIGAGISGIGAAYHLQRERPDLGFVMLEARDSIGGTWDLFRYPGIRSDSDLHTFAYEFKPWRDNDAIAPGEKIMAYLHETVAENRIDRHIRFHHRVRSANWSSTDARWLIEVERTDTGEVATFSTRWIFCGAGYYRYDQGYSPEFPGRERFTGQVVHPQHWPEDLDYAGKKVVIIGSGATAVTLLPAMAGTAAHVTMLQRSPTYMIPLRQQDRFAIAAQKLLGTERGYALARRKNILRQRGVYELCQRFPRAARRVIRFANARRLPDGYPVDEHFNPEYSPWDQRLCVVPDGDLFDALGTDRASVVTDRIETFTENGIKLASGRELDADIIVTATGLNIQLLGGMTLTVDGRPVDLADRVVYQTMMLTGVPNFVFAFGYTNSSWTLKVGLICEYFCRLLNHLDQYAYDWVMPVQNDPTMPTKPMLDFGAGYVQRVADTLPRQGVGERWSVSMNYLKDATLMRHMPVADRNLRFGHRAPAATEADLARRG